MYVMIRVQWTCTERINLIKTLRAAPKIIHIIEKVSITALIVNYCYDCSFLICCTYHIGRATQDMPHRTYHTGHATQDMPHRTYHIGHTT